MSALSFQFFFADILSVQFIGDPDAYRKFLIRCSLIADILMIPGPYQAISQLLELLIALHIFNFLKIRHILDLLLAADIFQLVRNRDACHLPAAVHFSEYGLIFSGISARNVLRSRLLFLIRRCLGLRYHCAIFFCVHVGRRPFHAAYYQ